MVKCLEHHSKTLARLSLVLLKGLSLESPEVVTEVLLEKLQEPDIRRKHLILNCIAATGIGYEDAVLVQAVAPLVAVGVSDRDGLWPSALEAFVRIAPRESLTDICSDLVTACGAGDGKTLQAGLRGIINLAEGGLEEAVDAVMSCLATFASQGEEAHPIKSWWKSPGSSRKKMLMVEGLLRVAPECDSRLSPTLAALLEGHHKSWEVINSTLSTILKKIQRGDKQIVTAMCKLLKSYSSPQLRLGERAFRFSFEYQEGWDTLCTALLNDRILEAGLHPDTIPQQRIIITDVHGYIMRSGGNPKCKERFPITVLFDGLPPIGSVGYVVRAAIDELCDLNGFYRSDGNGDYEQYLGQGFLCFKDDSWSLYRKPTESQSEPTLIARAEGEHGKPPVENWTLEVPFRNMLGAKSLEVMAVPHAQRKVLGNIDEGGVAKVAHVLQHIAEEGDQAAADAICLMATTKLHCCNHIEQVLRAGAHIMLADSGSADALALACDYALHHDAGVREASLVLMLKVARPEDLSTIKERLAHGTGQRARIFQELDRKFKGQPAGDAFTAVKEV